MKIYCFGIIKDITNQSSLILEEALPTNVSELRQLIWTTYPKLNSIKHCMIAVNQNYADDHQRISSTDEIAIIPPVSGG